MKFYTAESFMAEAAKILADRGQSYDSPEGERSMAKTVELFNLRTGLNLTETHGWIFQGCLKDVRQNAAGGKHEDSAVDRVCYALLKAESRFRDKMNTQS